MKESAAWTMQRNSLSKMGSGVLCASKWLRKLEGAWGTCQGDYSLGQLCCSIPSSSSATLADATNLG